jgi:hypothetical protein
MTNQQIAIALEHSKRAMTSLGLDSGLDLDFENKFREAMHFEDVGMFLKYGGYAESVVSALLNCIGLATSNSIADDTPLRLVKIMAVEILGGHSEKSLQAGFQLEERLSCLAGFLQLLGIRTPVTSGSRPSVDLLILNSALDRLGKIRSKVTWATGGDMIQAAGSARSAGLRLRQEYLDAIAGVREIGAQRLEWAAIYFK